MTPGQRVGERPPPPRIRNDAPRQRVAVDQNLLHSCLDPRSLNPVTSPEPTLPQCLKCRRPVNTIARPCSSAAAITSAILAPIRPAARRPSRRRPPPHRARRGTGRTHPTPPPIPSSSRGRSPPPSSAPPSPHRRGSSARRRSPASDPRAVKITVFDLTCAQTRHANRSACHSSRRRLRASSRPRSSADGHGSRASVDASRALHERRRRESSGSRRPASVCAAAAQSRRVDDAHVGFRRENRRAPRHRPPARSPLR